MHLLEKRASPPGALSGQRPEAGAQGQPRPEGKGSRDADGCTRAGADTTLLL